MAVTRERLTSFWRDLLRDLRPDCFYVGCEDAETVLKKLENVFGGRISAAGKPLPNPCGMIREGRGICKTESMPVAQSQLMMVYRCGVQFKHPDHAACVVLNELLGNSPISRLFVYVREKQSLCYSCVSSYSAYYGTFLISCGLKSESREAAEQEIKRQIECLACGDFRAEELEAAKKSLLNTYRQIEDSPSGLESYYFGRALVGDPKSLEECRADFEKVTADDVARIARTLTPDVTYFLEGTLVGDGEDEDED